MSTFYPGICIATSTMYKDDDPRIELFLKMLGEAVKYGLRIVCTDASSQAVKSQMAAAGGEYLELCDAEQGMGPARRQAMERAGEIAGSRGAVFWTEPEKWGLIRDVVRICKRIFSCQVAVVVPWRSAASWRSMPEYQVEVERYGNSAWKRYTGVVLDVWFGPRAISVDTALELFLEDDGMLWDGIFRPLIRIIAARLLVTVCDVDYIYPAEQVQEELESEEVGIERRGKQQANLLPAIRDTASGSGLAA